MSLTVPPPQRKKRPMLPHLYGRDIVLFVFVFILGKKEYVSAHPLRVAYDADTQLFEAPDSCKFG
jgi:hypothetical protein